MNRSDLFMMALQNLWARKSRTAFNIFGIVVSCSMLLLVFAGTRGAHDGLLNLFSQSDFARHFAITSGRDKSGEPTTPLPENKKTKEGVAKERVARINEKLNKDWENKNYPATRVTLDKIDELRELPDMASVLPNQAVRTQLAIEDQKILASVRCFSTETSNLGRRVVAGQIPKAETSRGKVWINECRAWRMGYETDKQLDDLIGTKIKLRFQKPGPKPSAAVKRFSSFFGAKGSLESEQLLDTFRKLFADLDQTSLSELEKEGVRAAANRLGLDVSTSIADAATGDSRFEYREFEIAGFFKPLEKSSGNLFQLARTNSGDLLIDWRDFHEIDKATHPERIYFYCIGTAKSARGLSNAISHVEESGFKTRSALEILEKADVELGKVRLIVAAIAFVILLIASVGIMNTMIIAVMERTPEFGIMKAVGSKDSDILWLMLIEAALTGILGAIVSFAAALVIDFGISQVARHYIETRIDHDFNFSIFVYSFSDILIVAAIAIVICMLASLIPSRRAAKLDPVDAMK